MISSTKRTKLKKIFFIRPTEQQQQHQYTEYVKNQKKPQTHVTKTWLVDGRNKTQF